MRNKIPGGKNPDLTSYGNVSIQVEVATRTLGYNLENLTDSQRRIIIKSIKDPVQNILISAKHLSELRDIDFKGKISSHLTIDDVKVIATRYNRGPNLSIDKIRDNMSYGTFITKRKSLLGDMLNE